MQLATNRETFFIGWVIKSACLVLVAILLVLHIWFDLQAIGDSLIDSVVSENIPMLTADEKFNETVTSIARRVDAVLTSECYTPPLPTQGRASSTLSSPLSASSGVRGFSA